MECKRPSVEEVWKSLKAQSSAPSSCRANWNSWSVKDTSKTSQKIQNKPLFGACRAAKENRKQSPDVDLTNKTKDGNVGEKTVSQSGNNNNKNSNDEKRPGIDEDDFSSVQKHVNALVDPRHGTRYAALLSLRRVLLGISEREHVVCEVPSEVQESFALACDKQKLAKMIEEVVAKPLLIRFSDATEKCRQLSISIFICLLQVVADSIITLIPYIFPVILERLPLKTISTANSRSLSSEVDYKCVIIEPSEEVRLLLVKLVHMILKHGSGLIHPFASDIASILMVVAQDPHPNVLLEAFATLEYFGNLMGQKLKPVARELVSTTCRSLSHNRCRIRVASLHAIQRLVLCGSHESIYDLTAYRDPNLLPIRSFYHPDIKTQYFALLATDKNNKVREEFLKMVTMWLLELPERTEHEVQLLPLGFACMHVACMGILMVACKFQSIHE